MKNIMSEAFKESLEEVLKLPDGCNYPDHHLQKMIVKQQIPTKSIVHVFANFYDEKTIKVKDIVEAEQKIIKAMNEDGFKDISIEFLEYNGKVDFFAKALETDDQLAKRLSKLKKNILQKHFADLNKEQKQIEIEKIQKEKLYQKYLQLKEMFEPQEKNE